MAIDFRRRSIMLPGSAATRRSIACSVSSSARKLTIAWRFLGGMPKWYYEPGSGSTSMRAKMASLICRERSQAAQNLGQPSGVGR